MMQSTMVHRMMLAVWMACFAGSTTSRGGEHGHEEDVVVGRTGSGQLAAEVPSAEAIELPPVHGLLNGWAAIEPGMRSLESDEPKEDFFVLGAGATVALELVSIDPALKVWSPGFVSVLSAPGNSFILGGSEFDTHPTYHIDSMDPGFDPGVNQFSATFRLFDLGPTGYAPSEPFPLTFTPIPEPATSLLFILGALGVAAGGARSKRQEGKSL
jgi:hypothetical protein